jgi:hypothetical protein
MLMFSQRRSQKSSAPSSMPRNRRFKRRYTVESLESRCLLAVTSMTPVPITVLEASAFNGAVMNFTANDAGPFTATIAWGDLTTTAGLVTPSGGGFAVSGTHTYVDDGSYPVTVTIIDTTDVTTTFANNTTATVNEAVLTSTATPFTYPENAAPTVTTGTFTDPGSTDPATSFSASIAWGDGTTTPGTVNGAAGAYFVTGSHLYGDEGTHNVITTFFENSNPTFTISTNSTATITEADSFTNGLIAVPAGTVEGQQLTNAQIATFSDPGFPTNTAGDFTASINWGDGGIGVGTVVALGGGNFGVQGSHQFNEEGSFSLSVTVADDAPGTATIAITGQAVIADAPLTASPVAIPFPANTGVALPSSTVVSTFTDANPTAPVSNFTAVIDWGDGSPTILGTIAQPGGVGTAFEVTGGHTYAKPGVYTTTINVLDDGGSTVTLTNTVTVTDLPVTTGATRNFTAVEGQDTGQFVLATFEDPNTLATVADVQATLAIGGWGDGTPTTAGVVLTVQQTGVDPANGDPVFAVLGNHTYAEETPAGLPDTLSVIITTSGGATTTLTSPPGGGVTVLDAGLTSSNGMTITGNEGIATPATTLLGTFTDANQGATVADYTAGGGSVVVNWGDGSAPQTLTAANLAKVGTANGVTWAVSAAHTFADAGTFAYTVTVTDDGGSVTIFSGTAVIAEAALSLSPGPQPLVNTTEAAIFPVPQFGKPVFYNTAVASFTDANPTAPVGDFTTLIDWGDGTPMSAGTVTQPGGVGTAFIVTGSHTYADSGVNGGVGTYPIQVFVVDTGGPRLTIDNTANVADNAIVLTGVLNPASDSGLSTGTPNVTNVKQPAFYGTSEPFSHVTLFAALGSGAPVQIGQVQAGSDGSWTIKSKVPLADGHYSITATAVDQFKVTTTTAPTVTITADLLIDTKGPVIDSMFFNRLNGQVDYIIQNPTPASGGAPAGVWVNSLRDSSNYLFTTVHPNKAYPGKWIVTNVTAVPDPTIPFAYDVAVTLNGGKIIPGGYYLFTIRDSSNGKASVQDLAENHLDGEFYGSFPSGNGIKGGDFVAELEALHNKVFSPQSIVGTANNANGGVGGLPVGAIHSGIWVPLDPRGGAPIFSTTMPLPAAKVVKNVVVVKAKPKAPVIAAKTSAVKKAAVVKAANHPAGPLHKK